jgi:hypothetical protein
MTLLKAYGDHTFSTRIFLGYQFGYTLCNDQVALLAAVIANIRYTQYISILGGIKHSRRRPLKLLITAQREMNVANTHKHSDEKGLVLYA